MISIQHSWCLMLLHGEFRRAVSEWSQLFGLLLVEFCVLTVLHLYIYLCADVRLSFSVICWVASLLLHLCWLIAFNSCWYLIIFCLWFSLCQLCLFLCLICRFTVDFLLLYLLRAVLNVLVVFCCIECTCRVFVLLPEMLHYLNCTRCCLFAWRCTDLIASVTRCCWF